MERIAEPLVAGIHAGDPETMSLRSTFPRFIYLEREYRSLIWGMYRGRKRTHHYPPSPFTIFVTFREGMDELVSVLEKSLPAETILKDHEVVEVGKIMKGAAGRPRYRLWIRGRERALETDALILATPSFVAAGFLKGTDGQLSSQLLSIPYVSTATINLAYRRSQIGHPLDGYGFVVPHLEGRKIMAATFSSIKFPNRAPEGMVLLRCFVGGAKNEELVTWADKDLLTAVRKDIDEILRINGEPMLVRIFRWDKTMPQYVIGHEERLSLLEKILKRHPGLFLTGSAYRGIGISDCVHQGELVAKKALCYLSS